MALDRKYTLEKWKMEKYVKEILPTLKTWGFLLLFNIGMGKTQ